MHLKITQYPKTTIYHLNELADLKNGLQLSYMNQVVNLDEVKLVIPQINKHGFYDVEIFFRDCEPLKLKIHYRVDEPILWQNVIFGQSTDSVYNKVVKKENSILIQALEGAGKITGDHDGISYYYTTLNPLNDNFAISAKINIHQYAKNPHDGQESFGIMLRDAIGENNNPSVFASNMVAVGGFSGSTKEPLGLQFFRREGVVNTTTGQGSLGIEKVMLVDQIDKKEYQFHLAKTNSGFKAKVDDGKWIYFGHKGDLTKISNTMYLGFYAARLADIEVSDINLTITSTKTDAPYRKVKEPKKDLHFENLTQIQTSNRDEALYFKANAKGILLLQQNNQTTQKYQMIPNQICVIPHHFQDKVSTINYEFIVDQDQNTKETNIKSTFSMMYRHFNHDIYASPDGLETNLGTENSPLDIQSALAYVQKGKHVYCLEGHYQLDNPLQIHKKNSGKEGNMKSVQGLGDHVLFDFQSKAAGFIISGSYWHIKNIQVCASKGNTPGIVVGGHHNIVEEVETYRNGDTGLVIQRTDDATSIQEWPSYNLIKACISHNNQDPSSNNADGFAAKVTSGYGNVFLHCVSHHNIDDGFDLYTKLGFGPIGDVLIEGCISYANGYTQYDPHTIGDGTGFKLGGEGIGVSHKVKNSLAFDNLDAGFTSNANPKVQLENVFSTHNKGANFDLSTYPHIKESFVANNLYSYIINGKGHDIVPKHLTAKSIYLSKEGISQNYLGDKLDQEAFENALKKVDELGLFSNIYLNKK